MAVDGEENEGKEPVRITVLGLGGNTVLDVENCAGSTVSALRVQLAEVLRCPPEVVRLLCDVEELPSKHVFAAPPSSLTMTVALQHPETSTRVLREACFAGQPWHTRVILRAAQSAGELEAFLQDTQGDDLCRTALHVTIEAGHEACVEACLDVAESASHAEAPALAVVPMIERLLLSSDLYGDTGLHWAAWQGHEACLTPLLAAAARAGEITRQHLLLAVDTSGFTGLHCAARQGHVVCLLSLLAAATGREETEGQQQQRRCAEGASPDLMRQLLLARDNDGGTSLDCAVWQDHAHCLPALLSAAEAAGGALRRELLLAVGNEGHTALHDAAGQGHSFCANLLLAEAQADARAQAQAQADAQAQAQRAAAAGAVTAAMPSPIPTATDQQLLFTIEHRDGQTALHCAAQGGHYDCISSLLRASREASAWSCQRLLFAIDLDGQTGLHWAAMNGHLDCVALQLMAAREEESRRKVNGERERDVGSGAEAAVVAGAEAAVIAAAAAMAAASCSSLAWAGGGRVGGAYYGQALGGGYYGESSDDDEDGEREFVRGGDGDLVGLGVASVALVLAAAAAAEEGATGEGGGGASLTDANPAGHHGEAGRGDDGVGGGGGASLTDDNPAGHHGEAGRGDDGVGGGGVDAVEVGGGDREGDGVLGDACDLALGGSLEEQLLFAKENGGCTALHLAAAHHEQACVAYFLHLAMEADARQQIPAGPGMLERLLFSRNKEGWTPLHCAGHPDSIKTILAGARVLGAQMPRKLLMAKDNSGATALSHAALLGEWIRVATLLQAARHAGHDLPCELLATTDYHGNTCLHAAASHGEEACLKVLLRAARTAGEDTLKGLLSALDYRGRAAVDYARENEHHPSVALLLSFSS